MSLRLVIHWDMYVVTFPERANKGEKYILFVDDTT